MTVDETVAKLMALVDAYTDAFHAACLPDGGIHFADGLAAKIKKDELRSALREAIDSGPVVAQQDWVALAYARLGMVRDEMDQDDVDAVQTFLGPLYARKQP